MIDRNEQEAGSDTGISAVVIQDPAVTESMGASHDRIQEHLGWSDQMVIRTRTRLIDAARALGERGEVPPGVDRPEVHRIRSGAVVPPRGADWVAATRVLRKAWVRQPALSRNVLGNSPAV